MQIKKKWGYWPSFVPPGVRVLSWMLLRGHGWLPGRSALIIPPTDGPKVDAQREDLLDHFPGKALAQKASHPLPSHLVSACHGASWIEHLRLSARSFAEELCPRNRASSLGVSWGCWSGWGFSGIWMVVQWFDSFRSFSPFSSVWLFCSSSSSNLPLSPVRLITWMHAQSLSRLLSTDGCLLEVLNMVNWALAVQASADNW